MARRGKKGKWIKGALTAAFAAAAIGGVVTGVIPTPWSSSVALSPVPKASNSQVLYAFNNEALREPWDRNQFLGRWRDMLLRQETLMGNNADRAAFQQYLSQFDELRDKSLLDKALGINATINKQVEYTSDPRACTSDGCANDYWESAVESTLTRKGDCEDYAILKYFTLRHLGVPADRLYLAAVDSSGEDKGVDHAVLLLNVAKDVTKESDFIVLDGYNNQTIVDSARSKYVWYDVMNETSFWMSDKALGIPPQNPSTGLAALDLPRKWDASVTLRLS